MKNLFILFVLLFSFEQLYCQGSITETENLNTLGLSGKVKRLSETSYNAKKTTAGIVKSSKGWQYDFENDSESFFDTLGNLVLENKILPNRKETAYSIKYDSLNRIISVNRLVYTHRFVYDSLNRIVSSQKENNPIGNTSKTEAGTQFIYHYNAENFLSKIESFDQSGVAIETFQYNQSGKVISSEWTKGNHIETHQYTYNENQLLIRDEWKNNEEGILEVTTFTYKDKVKTLEHWVDYEDGKPDGSIDDIFEKGNIIKTVEVDPDGVIDVLELCTYQFDSKGNWIKKTINCNEKYHMVERIIEYY
ncbi:MAG: hypothetical protein K0S23_1040 [Fluviicola sp.]|jgi:hypothetical protein|uniref:RHS repeat domain-containing protein n=1 Tax=Fluviicola sp. TaxID=1917219 RepID=UPI002610B92D|nr:hypothetical protein [Fluviicola sp.]MDF3026733.1 hypothetical protein [Fluviicola sp.]